MDKEQEERFQQLYGYRRLVLSVFKQLGFPDEKAEDLTQETYVRVLQSWEDYRGDARSGYLETIARRIAINELRHWATTKRAGMHLPQEHAEKMADERIEAAEDRLLRLENRDRLLAAVARLERKPQRLVRQQLGGASYRDIATFERMTEDAVRTALRDARVKLRQFLGEESGLGGEK
ncbi:MAG: sigma-70 family RNA polymerase sigma factor [Acidobacteria bacterium]|nr:sigma-70 family RNA polymerase sigma factor [Acidobacteriota bacterium]